MTIKRTYNLQCHICYSGLKFTLNWRAYRIMRFKTQNYVHRSGVESAHGSRDKRVLYKRVQVSNAYELVHAKHGII